MKINQLAEHRDRGIEADQPVRQSPKSPSHLSPSYWRRFGWFSDFEFVGRTIHVRKTGASTVLDAALLKNVALWLRFYMTVTATVLVNKVTHKSSIAIWYSPDQPRPWYMIRSVAAWAGFRTASSPEEADVAFHFDDSTWSVPGFAKCERMLNFSCLDISKSHVADLNERAFGYALMIDPLLHCGAAVEKGEVNSLHDGRIVQCPVRRLPGMTYQKLVDTEEGGFISDLRTQCIGRKPVLVWRKRRNLANRFASIENIDVSTHSPADVFSEQELDGIERFLNLAELDWGTLDILRDRNDGQIYIVDVNKTDVGPVLMLSYRDQIKSTRQFAKALTQLVRKPVV
jgi:hypothetical protein